MVGRRWQVVGRENMEKLSLDKKNLSRFGITMGVAFLAISLLFFLRHKPVVKISFLVSAAFFVLAFTAPRFLKPVYIFWMRLAFVLSFFNTRLLLFVLFYLVFTPIGLVTRLFRVDLLDRRIEKNRDSYWRKKEKKLFNRMDYERQF